MDHRQKLGAPLILDGVVLASQDPPIVKLAGRDLRVSTTPVHKVEKLVIGVNVLAPIEPLCRRVTERILQTLSYHDLGCKIRELCCCNTVPTT
jgi:hypothetical protein